jgi:hypothetical protein
MARLSSFSLGLTNPFASYPSTMLRMVPLPIAERWGGLSARLQIAADIV